MKADLEKLRQYQKDLKDMRAPHEESSPGSGVSRIEKWNEDVGEALSYAKADAHEIQALNDIFRVLLGRVGATLTQGEAEKLRGQADRKLQGILIRLEKKYHEAPGAGSRVWTSLTNVAGGAKKLVELHAFLKPLIGLLGTGGILVPFFWGDKPPEKVAVIAAPFDVAWCHPRQVTAVEPINDALLLGMITAARPLVMECLVDPKSRVSQGPVEVAVETRVDEVSGTHNVSGESLTPAGQQCIQKALEEHVPVEARSRAPRVSTAVVFDHKAATDAAVVSTENAAKDFAGEVRIAQAQWCDCYGSFASSMPPQLKMTVHLKKGESQASTVTFAPTDTMEGKQLAQCIQEKVKALPVSPSAHDIDLSLDLVHLHSLAAEHAGLPPELSYAQRRVMLHQRAADVSLALSARINAETDYQKIKLDVPATRGCLLPIKDTVLKRNAFFAAYQKQQEAVTAKIRVLEQLLDVAQVLEKKNLLPRSEVLKIQKTLKETQDDLTHMRQQELRVSGDIK